MANLWNAEQLRTLQDEILNGPHAAEYSPNVRLNDSPREIVLEDVPLWLPVNPATPEVPPEPDLDENGVQKVKVIERRVNPWVYDNAIAVAINDKKLRKKFVATELSSLALASRFPLGPNNMPGPLYAELVLQKIEGFADTAVQSQDLLIKLFGSQIKRQMVHLSGKGMDFGDPDMHQMFDQMQQAGALDEADVEALKSVAQIDDTVSAEMVSLALRGPWGDE